MEESAFGHWDMEEDDVPAEKNEQSTPRPRIAEGDDSSGASPSKGTSPAAPSASSGAGALPSVPASSTQAKPYQFSISTAGLPPPAPPPVFVRPEDDPLTDRGLVKIPLSMFPTAKIDDRPIAPKSKLKQGAANHKDAKGKALPVKKGVRFAEPESSDDSSSSIDSDSSSSSDETNVPIRPQLIPGLSTGADGADGDAAVGIGGAGGGRTASTGSASGGAAGLAAGNNSGSRTNSTEANGSLASKLKRVTSTESFSVLSTATQNTAAVSTATMALPSSVLLSHEQLKYLRPEQRQGAAAVLSSNKTGGGVAGGPGAGGPGPGAGAGGHGPIGSGVGGAGGGTGSHAGDLDVEDMLRRISIVLLQHIQRGEAAVVELGAAAADTLGPSGSAGIPGAAEAAASIPISLYKIAAGLVPGVNPTAPSSSSSFRSSFPSNFDPSSSSFLSDEELLVSSSLPFGFGIEAKLKRFRRITNDEGLVTADTAATDCISLLRSVLVSVCLWPCFQRRTRRRAGHNHHRHHDHHHEHHGSPSGVMVDGSADHNHHHHRTSGDGEGEDSTDDDLLLERRRSSGNDDDGRASKASSAAHSSSSSKDGHRHHHHHHKKHKRERNYESEREAQIKAAERKRLEIEGRLRAYRCWHNSLCCAPCRWLGNDGLDDGSYGPPVPSYHYNNDHQRYDSESGALVRDWDSATDSDEEDERHPRSRGGRFDAGDSGDDDEEAGRGYLDRDRFGDEDGLVIGAAKSGGGVGGGVAAASPRSAFFGAEAPPDSPSFRFRLGGASEVAGGFALTGNASRAESRPSGGGMIPLRIASPGQGDESVTSGVPGHHGHDDDESGPARGPRYGGSGSGSGAGGGDGDAAWNAGPRPEALYDAEVGEDVFHEARYLRPQYQLLYTRTCSISSPLTVDSRSHLTRMRYIFPMPSSQAIYAFMRRLFTVAKLSAESSIISLVYIERLLEGNKVFLRAHNWRPIVLCGLLLASKVWDDLNSWSVEFAAIYPQFTTASINYIERSFVSKIGFNLFISGSTYARYYFALRSLNEQRDFRSRYLNAVAASQAQQAQAQAQAQAAAHHRAGGRGGIHGGGVGVPAGGVGLGRAAPVSIVKKIEAKSQELKASLYSRSFSAFGGARAESCSRMSSTAVASPSAKLASSLLALGLVLVFLLGVLSRLFLTFRYEWYEVNEFDPQFQARVTKFMAEEGWHAFLNFFDLRSWYPLGRATGPTLYPGLMITSSLIYWCLQAINIPISITLVMHFLPPFFTGLTALACFALGREALLPPSSTFSSLPASAQQKILSRANGVGLLAAFFVAIVPGFAQRSVAGAYDNEAVAITALVLVFFCWLRALNAGSLFWGCVTALAYFFMVSAWGGYVLVLNLLPLHSLVLLIGGRFSNRLYVAYSSFYAVGTLLSMQISFVGFQPVYSAEHLLPMAVFALLQLAALQRLLRGLFASDKDFQRARSSIISTFFGLAALAFVVGSATGYLAPFTGRLWSLLDPTFAKANIPIIASVAEHQPTSWSSYFFDFHILAALFPAGCYFLLRGTGTTGAEHDEDEEGVLRTKEEEASKDAGNKGSWWFGLSSSSSSSGSVFAPNATDAGLFLVVYGAVGIYFSAVMIRLILTVAPAACVLGGVAIHCFLYRHVPIAAAFFKGLIKGSATSSAAASSSSSSARGRTGGAASSSSSSSSSSSAAEATTTKGLLSTLATALVLLLLYFFSRHSIWTISEAYSSPSIVMIARQSDGRRAVFDDYREAYYWLRQNTPEDAKIASWWDYGYQMSSMANRTVIVDNNTWNNTHIATVGRAMSTGEPDAHAIFTSLEADYVLVIFGGFSGYSGDDINKFYWMERIGRGVFPNEVPPESAFVGRDGALRIDKDAGPALLESLMFRLSFYRFGEVSMGYGYPRGLDRARNQELHQNFKNYNLSLFEEVFTSQHWIARIFKVKKVVGNRPLDTAMLPKPKAQRKVDREKEKQDWRTAVKAEWKAIESASSSSGGGGSSSGSSSDAEAATGGGGKKGAAKGGKGKKGGSSS